MIYACALFPAFFLTTTYFDKKSRPWYTTIVGRMIARVSTSDNHFTLFAIRKVEAYLEKGVVSIVSKLSHYLCFPDNELTALFKNSLISCVSDFYTYCESSRIKNLVVGHTAGHQGP